MTIAEKVKKMIVDQLGVSESEVVSGGEVYR